ncbi:MAG TPA: hypothetical protein VE153_37195 [Myxococcus sp.]|jgi:hypothetical protein|nr:hypothetical protein [Myxococcus sp.]
MLNTLKRTVLGLSLAAPAVVALLPQEALAYRAYSTAGCFTEEDFAGDYVWQNGIANQSNGQGARARLIRCPILDDNSVAAGGATVSWRPNLTAVYVGGYDGNNGIADSTHNAVASTCYVFYDGLGAECSVGKVLKPVSTDITFTGAFNVALEPAQINILKNAWQGDFSFIQISIPQVGPLGRSVVYGYSTY